MFEKDVQSPQLSIIGRTMQNYSGVQCRTNVHVSGLAYAEDIVLLTNIYGEMQTPPTAINNHATAVTMRITAPKGEVVSAKPLASGAKPSYLMESPWRKCELTRSRLKLLMLPTIS